MNNRTVNSARNIIIGLTNRIVILLLNFLGRKLFIQYIGVELLGLNGLFYNVLQFLTLADLGFGTAMAYSFYKPLSEKDNSKLTALTNFYAKVYNIIALSVLILGIMIIPFLKYIINLPSSVDHIYFYYLLFLANTVFSYVLIYKSTLLRADQKGFIIDKVSIIINVIRTITQIISVVVFKNYTIYLLIAIFSTLINNIVISRIADRTYPYLKENANSLSKNERKDIFSNLKSVFIYKFSSTLLNSVDNILISVILGTITVGLYSNYQTIIMNISQIVTIVFSSVTASIGNLVITGKVSEKYKIFKTMQMLSFWLSAVVSIGIFNLSNEFITLWLGESFVFDQTVVAAMSFNLFFSTSMQPLWSYREATALYQKTKYVMCITALLNLILSIPLGYIFGLSGIIFSTVFSRILTYFWYEPIILFQQYFKISPKKYFFEYFLNIFIVIILMILMTAILGWIGTGGFLLLLLKAILCVLIVSIAYIALYYRSEQFKILEEKVFQLCHLK